MLLILFRGDNCLPVSALSHSAPLSGVAHAFQSQAYRSFPTDKDPSTSIFFILHDEEWLLVLEGELSFCFTFKLVFPLSRKYSSIINIVKTYLAS